MIVVDSSIWISYLHGHDTEASQRLEAVATTDILIGDIILLEVLQGAQSARDARLIERELRQFRLVPMLDNLLAVKAAGNYRALRDRGITIRKLTDLIVGTYCCENGHQLLQQDRDFEPMRRYIGLELA